MNGRGTTIRLAGGLADDGRGDHDADRDRRRLPRLQREQRPAVRARPTGSRRRSATPPASAPTTRSGSAATGSAWSSRSTPSTAPPNSGCQAADGQRLDRRQAQPEARQERRAAARRLDDPGPLPLLLRPQVPGDQPRHEPDRAARGRRRCRSPSRRPQIEFDDVYNTFDTADPREQPPGARRASATPSPARGASLNQAIERPQPAVRQPAGRSPRRSRDPTTQLVRFFPELADAARIVAPVAVDNAEQFTNGAIAFGAISSDPQALRTRSPAGPPPSRPGFASLPGPAPVPRATSPSSRACCARASRDLRRALPVLNQAVLIGTKVLPRTRADEPRPPGRDDASSTSWSPTRRP